jgi:hypothetical protein
MRQSARRDRVLERPRDVLLAGHIFENLGTPFSGKHLVTHEPLTFSRETARMCANKNQRGKKPTFALLRG